MPLQIAGGSWPARVWAGWRCGRTGVRVQKVGRAFELRKGDRAVLLAAKHVFYADEVCRNFEAFAHALPTVIQDGVETVDFASDPGALNVFRACLRHGVTIEQRRADIWLHKGDRAMVLASRHRVYAFDMASKFELYFAPLVPEMREGLKVLDYSQPGRLQTYAGSGLQFEMASFPEEEEAIEEYFRWYRPQPGDLVFDMGAHCGVSTYHLSKLVGPEGRVVSFEPDPVNYAILQRNIERHGLSNVTAESVAIAGHAGELAFSSEGTIGSSLTSLLQRESVGTVMRVQALTLADVFTRWGVPAFCKIDIEGAEVEVIASSAELLRKHRPNFALDTNHPKENGQMTDGDVEAMFRSYGYETASEAKPLLTTWARPK